MRLKTPLSMSLTVSALQMLLLAATAVSLPAAARADDALGQFIAALEPKHDDSSAFFLRAFGARKSVAHDAAMPEQTAPAVDPRVILLADADPNFERWQRDANERLKHEKARTTPKLHPLAAAHPAKSVVVCEAGCGLTTKDEIVYIAPVVPAVVQASPSDDDSIDPAAANLADGELPCIAGCYAHTITGSREGRVEHSRLHDDGASETSFVLTATSPRTQSGQNGGIVNVKRQLRTAKSTSAASFYDGWRTKIVFPRSARGDAPSRAWQQQVVRHDGLIVSEFPDEAR